MRKLEGLKGPERVRVEQIVKLIRLSRQASVKCHVEDVDEVRVMHDGPRERFWRIAGCEQQTWYGSWLTAMI